MNMAHSKSTLRVLAVALLALIALSSAGCNTVAGIGEDVSAAGQGLADFAQATAN
jgi:predicted small secreted protein